jgi:hypothetical protein
LGNDIAIGESCIFGVNAQEAFQITGLKDISERKVELMIWIRTRRSPF